MADAMRGLRSVDTGHSVREEHADVHASLIADRAAAGHREAVAVGPPRP